MAGAYGSCHTDIIGDQRLPLRVVLEKCVEISLHEIGGGRHL
jgi:hypothetical protein